MNLKKYRSILIGKGDQPRESTNKCSIEKYVKEDYLVDSAVICFMP